MRSVIYITLAVAALLVVGVNCLLSSSGAAGSMREGQRIGMADAGTYNFGSYDQVSGWLSELD